MRLTSGLCVVIATSILGLVGCGDNDDSKKNAGAAGSGTVEETRIELFSWWVQPGEAEALQAVMELHKATYTDQRIFNAAAADGIDAKKVLGERLAANDPPDVFQQNAYEVRTMLATQPGALEPLDALFDAEGLKTVVPKEILEDVTVDGHIYSLPVNAHRENALFYHKQIFADNGLNPPTTQAEFLTVCETLKSKGIAAVAVSTTQGWILQKLFSQLALGAMGGQAFADYFSGNAPLDKEAFGAAVDVFDTVLTNYINSDAGEPDFGWTQATEAVFKGQAAMFLHGDWAKGYFVQLGFTPNVDFGVVGSPGAADVFVYGTDVFAIPVGAKQPDAARDFLKTVSSTDGQVAFNKIKGSSPMRFDVPITQFDTMGQEVLEDFQTAKIRVALRGKPAWDDAFAAFAKDHDKAALIKVFEDNPPSK